MRFTDTRMLVCFRHFCPPRHVKAALLFMVKEKLVRGPGIVLLERWAASAQPAHKPFRGAGRCCCCCLEKFASGPGVTSLCLYLPRCADDRSSQSFGTLSPLHSTRPAA